MSDEYKGVLVYSDDTELALEVLTRGREIADEMSVPCWAAAIGSDMGELPAKLISHGADKVFTASDAKLENFISAEYAATLEKMITEHRPAIVLIGSNRNGDEIAPRLAARFKTGCTTNCTSIELSDDHKLKTKRLVYGAAGLGIFDFKTMPQIATVAPKAYEVKGAEEGREGEVVDTNVDFQEAVARIVDVVRREVAAKKIEDSEIVVSIGRGLKSKEDIGIIEGLADSLSGFVGCSRPIAADLKWLSSDHWVGLSGHKVKPKLYMACGISGQIQHIAGMRDSTIIVAINNDADAPIFKVCDYGIVGDLYTVVPALTAAFKGS